MMPPNSLKPYTLVSLDTSHPAPDHSSPSFLILRALSSFCLSPYQRRPCCTPGGATCLPGNNTFSRAPDCSLHSSRSALLPVTHCASGSLGLSAPGHFHAVTILQSLFLHISPFPSQIHAPVPSTNSSPSPHCSSLTGTWQNSSPQQMQPMAFANASRLGPVHLWSPPSAQPAAASSNPAAPSSALVSVLLKDHTPHPQTLTSRPAPWCAGRCLTTGSRGSGESPDL